MSPSGPVTVGVDIGTTSVKAVAVDARGTIVDRVRVPHPVVVPSAGRLEHDADRAWRRGPRRALRQLETSSPAAVAVSSLVPSLTAVDRRGRPVTAGLLYGDERGSGEGGEAANFLGWLHREAPHAAGYWPAPAVANHALSGAATIDSSTAFASGAAFTGGDTALAACASIGVEPSQMPAVGRMGGPIGRVTGSGALLVGGSVDGMCEQLVAGADEVGDVLVIVGTTLITWAITADQHQAPGLWTIPHHLPGRWMVGGASNAGGLFVGWATGLLDRVTRRDGLDPRHIPVWVPYVRGERTPLHDPARRAALVDLDLTHGPAAVERAAWEASGFVVRHHLELAGIAPTRIVTTGGGTRVDGWMQALADCTGVPVDVAAEPEGAALGAAYLARMGLGEVSGLAEAATWARTGRRVDPDPTWHAAADERYQRFREAGGT